MKHSDRILPVLAALALSACAPGMMQAKNSSLPAFYHPGEAWDAPAEEPTSPDAVARDASLAPQELPHEKPEFWLDDTDPAAGPAPRNSISGGVLDVGVVRPAPHGKTAVAPPAHGLEPADSGRLYILELYQDVLDQRDALQIEVNGLIAELERAHAQVRNLQGAAGADRSALDALQQEVALLRVENQDLTARLTTAQVRRLEAEKLLLETRISMQRAELERSAPPASGIALKEERP